MKTLIHLAVVCLLSFTTCTSIAVGHDLPPTAKKDPITQFLRRKLVDYQSNNNTAPLQDAVTALTNMNGADSGFNGPLGQGVNCPDIQTAKMCDTLFNAFSTACAMAFTGLLTPAAAPVCATSLVFILEKECIPCYDYITLVSGKICPVYKILNGIDCNLYVGPDDGGELAQRCGITQYSHNKNDGASCSCNAECNSNSCGRPRAGTDNLVCCPHGAGDEMYAGYYYCQHMSIGTSCWSDAMCDSGYCKGNNGGLTKGVCTAKKDNGASCSVNADCKNNMCGRLQAGTDSLVCCPSNRIGTYGGYDYCYDMPVNTPCWSDAMCASGYCKGNNGGVNKGVCTNKLDNGASCSSNSDCKNNKCGRPQAGTDNLVCCPSNTMGNYGGYDYCYGMGPGTPCWSDAMCKNGNCKGNAYGLQKGHCN